MLRKSYLGTTLVYIAFKVKPAQNKFLKGVLNLQFSTPLYLCQ